MRVLESCDRYDARVDPVGEYRALMKEDEEAGQNEKKKKKKKKKKKRQRRMEMRRRFVRTSSIVKDLKKRKWTSNSKTLGTRCLVMRSMIFSLARKSVRSNLKR